MKIEINLENDLLKAIEKLSKAWHLNVQRTIEFLLTGSLAKKAAWGDLLKCPEPGIECVITPEGKFLEGEKLYKDVYEQTVAHINSLLVGENLLELLVSIIPGTEKLTDPTMNKAFEHYKAKLKNSANRPFNKGLDIN